MKTKLDLTGMSKSEIKEVSDYNNYSKSTFYNSINRGFIYTKID